MKLIEVDKQFMVIPGSIRPKEFIPWRKKFQDEAKKTMATLRYTRPGAMTTLVEFLEPWKGFGSG